MKKAFHLVSLLALLLTFAASTAWAAQRTLTADGNGGYYINMPATGVDTLVVPDEVTTFKVYDDGGKNRDFSSRCDGFLVISAPAGHVLRAAGYVSGMYNRYAVGALRIWGRIPVDGDFDVLSDENGSMGIFVGDEVVPNRLSYDRDMVLRFWHYNKDRGTSAGMNLTVTVVDKDGPFAIEEVSVTGGHLIDPPATAAIGEVVSVTASNAAEGYVFDCIKVKDERGHLLDVTGGTWLTGKTGTFVMPSSNAFVEPVYVTEKEGVHLHMPYDEMLRMSIPEDVVSFVLDGDAGEFEPTKPFVLTVPEGYLMRFEGLRSDVASSYDAGSAFYVYDGDIPDAYESRAELVTGVSSGQTVTIVFVGSGEFTGTMRVTLVDASQPHYIIAQSSSSGMGDIEVVDYGNEGIPVGARVKIVAHPADGYMFSGVRARNDYTWTDLDVEIIEDSVWFTMPFADVRVIPNFASIDNPYFLVPLKGVSRIDYPEDASEISICNNEGCMVYYDHEYSNGNGILVLTAPEGYKLYAYGDVQTASWDYLEIFDGADTNANLLFKESGNDELYQTNSSTQSLTFRFNSTGWGEGFNIKVGLVDLNQKYKIYLSEVSGGFIGANMLMAAAGDTVSLIAFPNEDYILDRFNVRWYDPNYGDHYVNTIGGTWYSDNVAKFVMPAADVDVGAFFDTADEGEFGITIPKEDTLRINIPEGMAYFYVDAETDDRENYLNNSDGVVVLTAPEGYFLEVSGEMEMADEGDSLVIYDGAGIGAERLLKVPDDEEFEVISAGSALTFHFKTNESEVCYGRGMLYVSVLKKKPESSLVKVFEYANGSTQVVIDGSYEGPEELNFSEEIEVDYVYIDRVFTPEAFSTFVLPFNYNANDIWGLEQVLEFAGVGELDGKKVVKMKRVWCQEYISEKCASLAGDLDANKPYMLKTMYSDIYFHAPVTLKKTTEAVTTVGDWQFRGTYSYKTWAEGDSDLGRVYGFAGSNADNINIGDFVKAGAGAWINPLRAYLIYNPNRGNAAPPAYAPVRDRVDIPEEMDVVIIDDDDNIGEKTMAIGRINTRTGVFTSNRSYDLKGRSVNSAPKAKGVYVKGRR